MDERYFTVSFLTSKLGLGSVSVKTEDATHPGKEEVIDHIHSMRGTTRAEEDVVPVNIIEFKNKADFDNWNA